MYDYVQVRSHVSPGMEWVQNEYKLFNKTIFLTQY